MYGRASGVPAVRRYVAAFFKVCALYGAVYAACALAQTRSSVVSAIATDAPPYTLAVARQSVSARTTRALSPRPRLARANLFLSSSPLLSWRRALARAIFRAVVRSGSLPSCRRRRPRRPSPIPWRRGAHPRVCVCVARPRHASPPHAAAVDALALRRCSGAARALLWRCSGAAAARTRRHHTAHTHTHTHTPSSCHNPTDSRTDVLCHWSCWPPVSKRGTLAGGPPLPAPPNRAARPVRAPSSHRARPSRSSSARAAAPAGEPPSSGRFAVSIVVERAILRRGKCRLTGV